MKEHPINEILRTSLENIGQMVDTNKVVGEPIILPNNVMAIPISRVVCGYGVGGSEFATNNKNKIEKTEIANEIFPFGGGSGGGLTITPTAFIIIKDENINIMNIEKENELFIKLFEAVKDMIKK